MEAQSTGTEYTLNEQETKKVPKLFTGVIWGILISLYGIIFLLLTAILTGFVQEGYNNYFRVFEYEQFAYSYSQITILDKTFNIYPIGELSALLLGMFLAIVTFVIMLLIIRVLLKTFGSIADWWNSLILYFYDRNLLRFTDTELTQTESLELIGLKLFKINCEFLPVSFFFLILDTFIQFNVFMPIYIINIVLLLFGVFLWRSPKFAIPNLEKEITKTKQKITKLEKREAKENE